MSLFCRVFSNSQKIFFKTGDVDLGYPMFDSPFDSSPFERAPLKAEGWGNFSQEFVKGHGILQSPAVASLP